MGINTKPSRSRKLPQILGNKKPLSTGNQSGFYSQGSEEIMTDSIRLDNDADHELSESGTSGTVWIAMSDDVSVEIYFETDSNQHINLLSVGDCYQEIDGISTDYAYTLQFEHEPTIKAVINKFLWDNPVDDSEPQPDWHDQRTYGLSNSDFLHA